MRLFYLARHINSFILTGFIKPVSIMVRIYTAPAPMMATQVPGTVPKLSFKNKFMHTRKNDITRAAAKGCNKSCLRLREHLLPYTLYHKFIKHATIYEAESDIDSPKTPIP